MHVQMFLADAECVERQPDGEGVVPPMSDWRKSARSGAQGNCVELARVATGDVLVRNSRFPAGPVLEFSAADMAGFVQAIKAGDFDELISADGV